MSSIVKQVRGASMVEYVMAHRDLLLSAGAWKAFAPKVRTSATSSAAQMGRAAGLPQAAFRIFRASSTSSAARM